LIYSLHHEEAAGIIVVPGCCTQQAGLEVPLLESRLIKLFSNHHSTGICYISIANWWQIIEGTKYNFEFNKRSPYKIVVNFLHEFWTTTNYDIPEYSAV
jgi:hypothetical protein